MVNTNMLIAAATLAVASLAGGAAASADPWDAHRDRLAVDRPVMVVPVIAHPVVVREEIVRRPIVLRERVFETLRLHHYRGIGEPYFMHGHYLVRVNDHVGRPIVVEIDPYTGAFIGEFRA